MTIWDIPFRTGVPCVSPRSLDPSVQSLTCPVNSPVYAVSISTFFSLKPTSVCLLYETLITSKHSPLLVPWAVPQQSSLPVWVLHMEQQNLALALQRWQCPDLILWSKAS